MRIAMFRRVAVPALCWAGAAALWAGPTLAADSMAAASQKFETQLSGQNQVPAVDTQGTGTADFSYNPGTHRLNWTITYSGLSGPVMAAHIHSGAAGANGKVLLPLTKKGATDNPSPIKGHATLTDDQAKEIMSGNTYVNVHTDMHKSGEIRGQITPPAS